MKVCGLLKTVWSYVHLWLSKTIGKAVKNNQGTARQVCNVNILLRIGNCNCCIVDALKMHYGKFVVDRVACLHLGHRYSQPPQVTLWLRSQKYPVAVASNFPRLMMHEIFLLFTREYNRDAVIMHSIISPRYPESASIIVVLSVCCPHFSMNFLSHSLVIEHNYVTQHVTWLLSWYSSTSIPF